MNFSSIPSRILKAFGVNGTKNTIPSDSTSTTLSTGKATSDSGFPPITMIAKSAGGIPPSGGDFNGVFYDITLKQQWQDAGMSYPFDATFSTAISGYPKGALLPSSTFDGFWLNTANGNTSNPENTDGSSTNWIPLDSYGVTIISGLTNASVTLTALQALKERIILSGTLTANINIIFPAWTKKWTIVNNCTGNFTVTAKTTSISGTGTTIQIGTTVYVYGDGTSIIIDSNVANYQGRLIGPPIRFTSSGTYTATPGTKFVIVEVQGAGGAGGGAAATGAGAVSMGSGGTAGTYGKGRYTSGFTGGIPVVVGTGGVGTTTASTAGGNSSFGSLLSCIGGGPGARRGPTAPPFSVTGAPGGSVATGANIISSSGGPGGSSFAVSTLVVVPGVGGSSTLGGGGALNGIGGNGIAGPSAGSGGSGAANTENGATALSGGNGGNGLVIVWEYA